MKNLAFTVLAFASLSSYAQTESIANPFKISGYVDVYYSYDFGNPTDHNRPGFMYAYNRHNEISLHLGLVKAKHTTDNVRANLALMTGNYPNPNLAAEPGVLKNIYEEWYVSALVLNGWQRIQRVDGNNTPAFGHQLTYKPNSKLTLNSSSFIGNDLPDSTRVMRYFHNFYLQYQATEKLGLIFGFDIGAQQISNENSDYHTWYSPAVIAQYAVTDKIKMAARGEYYDDENGVIINTGTSHGFKTLGYSLNFDYTISENLVWRIEARALSSKDKIFTLDHAPSTQNYFVTTALAIAF